MALLKPVLVPPGRSGTASRGSHQTIVAPDANSVTSEWVDAQLAIGRLPQVLRAVNENLARRSADPELSSARAKILDRWGRSREATEAYMRAEAYGNRTATLYTRLAWSCFPAYGAADAEPWLRKALEADPQRSEAHAGLAFMLYAQRRYADAIDSYERALSLGPGDFAVLTQYGHCLLDGGDARHAEAVMRQALVLAGEHAGAWSNLGITLVAQRREAEAGEAFERAMRAGKLSGTATDAFMNLATYYRDSGRIGEAIDLFERYLPSRPDPYGHLTYALLLLLSGRFAEGWMQHEFRWLNEPLRSSTQPLPIPSWAGQDLEGRTLLLRYEQGVGDMIQFIRYAPSVKALGARTVLSVPPEHEKFARSFAGIDYILQRGEVPPAIDFQINLLSFPRVFGTDIASIPCQIPYVAVDPERAQKWTSRIPRDGELNVGLAWAGDPRHGSDYYRSASLRNLQPLWEAPGVRFISLQKGAAEEQIADLQVTQPLDPLGPEIGDWLDTAAIVDRLDLVICVDTGVAHLAGALGKPVWLMLPGCPDWRWLLERSDSPWYPTMRLFRQTVRGDWDDVVQRLKDALIERVHADPVGPTGWTKMEPASIEPVAPVAPLPAPGNGICAVAETRYGTLQYLPSEPLVAESLAWYGEWRQAHVDLLARIVRPGMAVVEVGAGVGALSLFLGERIGDSGELFLYEQRPSIRSILRNNLGARGLRNATVMGDSLNAGAGVERETIDELCLSRLDLLIVNTPEAVESVLAGASETAWRLRPLLLLSANDHVGAIVLANRTRDVGYRSWRCDAPLFHPNNFNRRESDIFHGRSEMAVLGIPEEFEVDLPLRELVEIT